MKRVFEFFIIFLFCSHVWAKTYTSSHFIIDSDLDHRYLTILQLNVEKYYENMVGNFFAKGWEKSLKIYYLKNQSDTQKLLKKHGHKYKVGYGCIMYSEPAVYSHQFMNDGGPTGFGTLFHEVTHHFVSINYKDVPTWFNEGLATFLGEQTKIVNGKLTVGRPNPWRERILRDMIENGRPINIKFLTLLTTETKFHNWEPAYPVARAFFYWLYEADLLGKYLENVRQKGYGLSVIEETVGKPYKEINDELLAFIKTNCYPAAYYEDGCRAKDIEEKKKFFEKALEIKPSYQPAILELARYFHAKKDHEKCRQTLKPILDDTQSILYRDALYLTGGTFYENNLYAQALEFYQKTREYSEYNEYKYEIAYWIANCCYYLKDYEKAKQWHKTFLDENWEPERHSDWVAYAQDYLKRTN